MFGCNLNICTCKQLVPLIWKKKLLPTLYLSYLTIHTEESIHHSHRITQTPFTQKNANSIHTEEWIHHSNNNAYNTHREESIHNSQSEKRKSKVTFMPLSISLTILILASLSTRFSSWNRFCWLAIQALKGTSSASSATPVSTEMPGRHAKTEGLYFNSLTTGLNKHDMENCVSGAFT